MLAMLMLAIVLAASPAREATSGSAEAWTGPLRLSFEVLSRDAWPIVQARLKELGIPAAQVDPENQLILTRWRDASRGDRDWLPAASIPGGYAVDRVRFVVFVSPFVEPAAISVGSFIEATRMQAPRNRAFIYNDTDANRALLTALAASITDAGLPKYEAPDTDPCAAALPRASGGGKITPPRKVPLSVFEIPFPAPATSRRTSAAVILELQIRTDGGVGGLRVLSSAFGDQLEAAALGATSLLVYSPARIDGCPRPTTMTYTVNFRPR